MNIFRVKPRANLGLIFFTVLIRKSEKQWKVLSGCLKNLPSGFPSGHQTTTADFPLFIPDLPDLDATTEFVLGSLLGVQDEQVLLEDG